MYIKMPCNEKQCYDVNHKIIQKMWWENKKNKKNEKWKKWKLKNENFSSLKAIN